MSPTVISVIIGVVIVIIVGLVLLYRAGSKAQVKQAETVKTLEAYAQVANILVIDKKKMRYKDAPLPQEFLDQLPKRARFMNTYVVRAKVGPRVFNMLCERNIFELLPDKGMVKAKISGLYIMEIIGGAQPSEKQVEKRKKAKEKAERKEARKAAKQDKLSEKAIEDARKKSRNKVG